MALKQAGSREETGGHSSRMSRESTLRLISDSINQPYLLSLSLPRTLGRPRF